MNERIKNRIKLVSSFLMCVLSLSAAITLSFAWFAKNDTVNGGGMSVAIENDANVVGAEYFIAEKSVPQSSSSELKFTKITDGNPVRMGAYDILDKKYQLLAKVYLKSDMETIRVTGNTQTAYFLGALENNKSKYPLLPPSGDVNVPQESTTDDGITYTNVLSSVINFTIFQAGELTALTNGSGYELVSDTLPSGNRIAKFIADSATATAPTSSINLVQTEIIKRGDEFFLLVPFGGVCFRHPYPRNGTFHRGVYFRSFLPRSGKSANQVHTQSRSDENHNRNYRKQNERKPRIDETYHYERADNRKNG